MSQPPQEEPEKPRALRILLAEDNPVNERIARRLLERMGHEVESAKDGIEAVSKAGNNEFDVVLMDCHMPRMDGLQATRTIRAMGPKGKALPVVALTASVMEEDKERCKRVGMDDFLSKPLVRSELERVLGELQERGLKRQEAA